MKYKLESKEGRGKEKGKKREGERKNMGASKQV